MCKQVSHAQSAVQKAIADYEKKHNLKDGKIIEAKKEDKVDTDALSPEIKALIDAQSTQIAALTTAD